MAHKKGQGSVRNGRDSNAKHTTSQQAPSRHVAGLQRVHAENTAARPLAVAGSEHSSPQSVESDARRGDTTLPSSRPR
jgi:hypothetical protein